MNWFKNIMSRFFTTEVEEDERQEETVAEKEEYEPLQTEKRNAPSFRFPIITDAEIYGWEEEGPADRPLKEPDFTKPAQQDDYEIMPLYKNDRWPEDSAPGKIHRANPAPKYSEPSDRWTGRTAADRVKEDQREQAPPAVKRSSRPFSPTEIPSPVFGFSKPEVQPAEMNPLIDKAKESLPLPKTAAVSEQTEPVEHETELKLETDEISRITKEETDHTTANEKYEQPLPNLTTDSVFQPAEQLEQAQQEDEPATEGIQKQEFTEEPKQEEPQQEEPLVQTAADQPEMTQEAVQPEQLSAPQDAEVKMEREPQAERKEKVRPFNVLMLKSDKDKMNKVQAFMLENEKLKRNPKPAAPKQTVETGSSLPNAKLHAEPAVAETKTEEEQPAYYALPHLDYLIPPEKQAEDAEWLHTQSKKLEEALSHFSIQANVIEAVQGPSVTRLELTVAQGTKVSKIRNLADDLKLALAAEDIRIQAPIPGRSSIGIEVPNRKTRPVRISEVIGSEEFQTSTSPLEAVLGLDLTGIPVTIDLRKMPHGMIAGATGSGKSVCINSILTSLLYKAAPTDLKMMLIDPKMVELAPFNGIPHLISPVITDIKAATAALKWAVGEMERRYELLAHAGARDIERYNKIAEDQRLYSNKMPYLLIVIDELADLMMMAPADVEVSISRIAQKARACGIHLIIATQRPSVDVITGTIKANIPTRIAFAVSSQIDSRTILDTQGADRLLGKGDMLYIGNGQSSPVRLQGTFVTDDEIERIIEHVRSEAEPDYLFGQQDLLTQVAEEEDKDPLFEEACQFILEQGSASTSLLQRNFSIGYNRAAKLIDRMEKNGFISGQRGSKARDVYITESDLQKTEVYFD